MRNIREFNHVVVTLAGSGEKRCVYKSGIGLDAIRFAMDNVVKNDAAFDKIEVREHWGEEGLHVVWVSDRMIRNISQRINSEARRVLV
jgi:hypothetical protein